MVNSPDKQVTVAATLREIAHLHNEAVEMVSKNDFYVWAGTTDKDGDYTCYVRDPAEMPALKVFVLEAIWRQISLRVQRCEDAGVPMASHTERETWINLVLMLGGSS